MASGFRKFSFLDKLFLRYTKLDRQCVKLVWLILTECLSDIDLKICQSEYYTLNMSVLNALQSDTIISESHYKLSHMCRWSHEPGNECLTLQALTGRVILQPKIKPLLGRIKIFRLYFFAPVQENHRLPGVIRLSHSLPLYLINASIQPCELGAPSLLPFIGRMYRQLSLGATLGQRWQYWLYCYFLLHLCFLSLTSLSSRENLRFNYVHIFFLFFLPLCFPCSSVFAISNTNLQNTCLLLLLHALIFFLNSTSRTEWVHLGCLCNEMELD